MFRISIFGPPRRDIIGTLYWHVKLSGHYDSGMGGVDLTNRRAGGADEGGAGLQRNSGSVKNSVSRLDGLAKSPKFVMPDLIRHPEHIEITGFRPSPE